MPNRATSPRSGTVLDLPSVLGPWSQGPGPLFRNLGRSIAHAIERGALRDGDRLPSERAVAGMLAIGRGTAVAAYDLLVADGLVERRRGSGTYVRVSDQPPLPPGREGSALVQRLVEQDDTDPVVIDLSISVLPDARALPHVALSTNDLLTVAPDTGYGPRGLASLRLAVAEHVSSWGLPTNESQVVITTGAQQAISATAACWVRPGDTVVVDDPTYPGALAAFIQAGARVIGARVDEHGVRPDALAAALDQRPALVYLQSTLHSPTGSVLTAERRREVAALLTKAQIPLVEDLALANLAWVESPAPIAAQAPDASIAVIGSLSKLFWGGLRLGFIRAPEPVALRFARIKATRDLGTSVLSQMLAERLLRSPSLESLRQEQTTSFRFRYQALAEALADQLSDWRWNPPQGGLSIWVDTREPSEPFAQHSLRQGVAVATPSALSASADHDTFLRLSFASQPDTLRQGVERLARAWRTRPQPG